MPQTYWSTSRPSNRAGFLYVHITTVSINYCHCHYHYSNNNRKCIVYLHTSKIALKTHRQLRAFEMGCLQRIMAVTRRDHIKNSDVKAKLKLKDDVEKIQTSRPRYFSHATRMDKCRLPYIAPYGRVEGNRAKGHSRKRWLDNVTEDCKRRGWDLSLIHI